MQTFGKTDKYSYVAQITASGAPWHTLVELSGNGMIDTDSMA